MIGNRWKTWFEAPKRVAPHRALLHPAFLVAVFVLVTNDHVLKQSDAAGLLTGKLSDFAGLFFAPVLLAALLGVRTRRGLGLSALLTAFCFALINTSVSAAAAFDGLASLIHPFHTTVDPTDLVALIAIPAGLWVLEPCMSAAAAPLRRLLEYASLTVAGLASIATSQGPCAGANAAECNFDAPDFVSHISILNKTNELHALRVRIPQPGVELDCDIVARDPNAYLPASIFGPPQTWLLQSGQEIPVGGAENEWGEWTDPQTGDCRAALVESDSAPDILVFWGSDLPTKSFPFDADVPAEIPADPQTIVLGADYSDVEPALIKPWRNRSSCGGRADLCADDVLAPLAEIPPGASYSWRSNDEPQHHFVRPPVQEGTVTPVSEECQMADLGDSLSWEATPSGDLIVVGIEPGLDGCHQLRLLPSWAGEDTEPTGWWLCVPFDHIASLAPQDDGSTSRIAVIELNQDFFEASGPHTGLRIDVITDRSAAGELDQFRTIHLVRGHGLPRDIDFGFAVQPRDGCEPVEGTCGQTAIAANVVSTTLSAVLVPGEAVVFEDSQPVEVQIVRAEYRPVRNPNCEAQLPASGPATPSLESLPGYFEAVIVTQ